MCGFSSTARTMASAAGRDRARRSRRPWQRSPDHRSGTTTCAPPGRSSARARSARCIDPTHRPTPATAAARSSGRSRQGRLIEPRQDPLVGVDSVTRCRPGPRQIAQPTQALARKARAPSADPPRPGRQLIGNRAGRAARRRQQDDARPLDNPVFSLRRSDHGFKRRPLLLRQLDRRRFLDVHPILESRLHLRR